MNKRSYDSRLISKSTQYRRMKGGKQKNEEFCMRATLNDVFDIALLTAGLSMLVQPCASLVIYLGESPLRPFFFMHFTK